jgi:hypothetical protein
MYMYVYMAYGPQGAKHLLIRSHSSSVWPARSHCIACSASSFGNSINKVSSFAQARQLRYLG